MIQRLISLLLIFVMSMEVITMAQTDTGSTGGSGGRPGRTGRSTTNRSTGSSNNRRPQALGPSRGAGQPWWRRLADNVIDTITDAPIGPFGISPQDAVSWWEQMQGGNTGGRTPMTQGPNRVMDFNSNERGRHWRGPNAPSGMPGDQGTPGPLGPASPTGGIAGDRDPAFNGSIGTHDPTVMGGRTPTFNGSIGTHFPEKGTIGVHDPYAGAYIPNGFGTTYDGWRNRRYGGGGGGGGYPNQYVPAWLLGLNNWNFNE